MDANQIEKLKALALAATPGPWQWWTSNSTLRLTGADGKDGGVLYGYVHAGVGDVSCSEPNRVFIEASNPAAVLELSAEVERLRAELATRCREEGGDTSDKSGAALAAGTVEKDAERWRYRKQFLASQGAIMFTVSGCQLRWAGELVSAGANEEEAIDAAIEAHTKAGKANA